MKIKILIFLLVTSMYLISNAIASPVSVPLSDPIYPFLDRMETLSFLSEVHDGIKPFTRTKISRHLQLLIPQMDQLTHIDRRRLQDFLLDYRRELKPQTKYHRTPENQNWYSVLGSWDNFKKDFSRYFKQNHPEEEDHVFLYEKENDDFYFDYEQGLTYEQRSDDVYRSSSWQKYLFRGTLNHNFGYQAVTELHGLRGDEPYLFDIPILKGSWSHVNETGPRYSDRTGGEMYWHTNYLDIQFAQQEIEWGYGESGKLILSRNPEHYPYLSLSKDWGWVKFISLHGKLQSFPQDTLAADGQKIYPDKWLAAQRLEATLWKRITIGLNENFIYGNRYVDWAYFFPFNFYRAVQHKLRDRDNATISLDLELLVYRGMKLYGTVFLDEFKMSEIGSDWFGNKHAFHGGVFLADPFKIPNLSLRLEYTAIMPWVYTHKYRINSYTSDYQSLGHWAGPNSEVWYLHLQKEWHQRFKTGFTFRQFKHGDNYKDENIGGDILIGRGDTYGKQIDVSDYKDTREFLEGILTTERRYTFDAEYEVFNDMFFSVRYHLIYSKTDSEHKNLREIFIGVLFKY